MATIEFKFSRLGTNISGGSWDFGHISIHIDELEYGSKARSMASMIYLAVTLTHDFSAVVSYLLPPPLAGVI